MEEKTCTAIRFRTTDHLICDCFFAIKNFNFQLRISISKLRILANHHKPQKIPTLKTRFISHDAK